MLHKIPPSIEDRDAFNHAKKTISILSMDNNYPLHSASIAFRNTQKTTDMFRNLYTELTYNDPSYKHIYRCIKIKERDWYVFPKTNYYFGSLTHLQPSTVKLLPILQAFSYIETSTYNKYIISSDSKSVVTALKKLDSNNTIIQNIIEINSNLHTQI